MDLTIGSRRDEPGEQRGHDQRGGADDLPAAAIEPFQLLSACLQPDARSGLCAGGIRNLTAVGRVGARKAAASGVALLPLVCGGVVDEVAELVAAGYAELGVGAVQVRGDGAGGQEQAVGDLAVG